MWAFLVAAGSALVALAAIITALGARARTRALTDEVRDGVEPYLRRKAAESGVPAAAPTWTSRATPEQIVGYSGRLARQLLEAEKAGPTTTTTKELEMAQTQPVDDIDGVIVSTGKTRKTQ